MDNCPKSHTGLFFRSVIILLLIIWAAYATLPAFAQTIEPAVPTLEDKAIEFARKIERENLVLVDVLEESLEKIEELSDDQALPILRRLAIEAIFQENTLEPKKAVAGYLTAARKSKNPGDLRLAELLTQFEDNFDQDNLQENLLALEDVVSPFTEDTDWRVAFYSWHMMSTISSYKPNFPVALEYAEKSLALIPEEISEETIAAKIHATSNINYLHVVTKNRELALDSSIALLSMQQAAQEPFDGITQLNNLIYVFSVWRDFETAKEMGDIVLRVERQSKATTPGLTQMRVGRIYNELGNYAEAMALIDEGLAVAENEMILGSLRLQRAISLAGMRDLVAARKAMAEYLDETPDSLQARNSFKRQTTKARALIALAEGDMTRYESLNRSLVQQLVVQQLKSNTNDTATLLASLQNSKERQDEREDALRTEAKLRQDALEEQTKLNRTLWATLIAVIIATIAFMLYRTRAHNKLAIAAKKAMVGEKVKSEFLAVMSHELRTPLNGILGLADYLSREAPTEDVKAKNAIILKSGHELLSLVENILDMTQIESDDIVLSQEPTNVREIVLDVEKEWRPHIESKDIAFTVHIADNIPEIISTDAARFRQCVNILLSNAAKFTDQGRVHVHVTASAIGKGQSSEIKVIVADTGVGIAKSAMDVLFKPFVQADSSFTRFHGGAGLGLAIARSLARMMMGDIVVASSEGRGSEFTFTIIADNAAGNAQLTEDHRRLALPIAKDLEVKPAPQRRVVAPPAVQPADSKHLEDANIAFPGMRVLVVEDDLRSQEVLASLLQPMGCELTCVDSGRKALEVLDVASFDVVLMDIRMPGMDGVTTVRNIRRSEKPHSQVPIIAVTADAAPETNVRCMAAGVDVFLTKPVRSNELHDSLTYVTQYMATDIAAADTA